MFDERRKPTKDELVGANGFRDRMLDWTQRLVRLDANGFGSGLLVQREKRLFLIAGGHVLNEGQWAIETNWIVGGEVLSFGVRDPLAFHSDTSDFAWSELDMRRIADKLKSDEKVKANDIDLQVYTGPLDRPLESSMPYGFAAWKAAEFVEGSRLLVRDPHFELGMTYVGIEQESKLLMFKPNDDHRGHAYYKGCSGAPIAGADGAVVALLVRGFPKDNPTHLLGVPLHDKERMLGNRPTK